MISGSVDWLQLDITSSKKKTNYATSTTLKKLIHIRGIDIPKKKNQKKFQISRERKKKQRIEARNFRIRLSQLLDPVRNTITWCAQRGEGERERDSTASDSCSQGIKLS